MHVDTGIAEEIIGHTVTDEFNKVLEVQQSKITNSQCYTHAMKSKLLPDIFFLYCY